MSSGLTPDKGSKTLTEAQVVINIALVARIEAFEAECHSLHSKISITKLSHFRLDSLVFFYTGFQTYDLLLTFYEFLGPSVTKLTYCGSKKEEKDETCPP